MDVENLENANAEREQATPMPPVNREYFIVKHGLDAFKALPSYIWRTDKGELEKPRGYNQVKAGDRWVAFAYTTSDERERHLSVVTGFFECVEKAKYCDPPLSPTGLPVWDTQAWFIEGKPFGDQPKWSVSVKPIGDILPHRKLFNQQAIVRINAEDFEAIRQHTLNRQFDIEDIPLLKRDPQSEQELLAVVVYGHKQLGIERIIRVRTAFPDLLVQFEGSPDEVHLELEVYSEGFFLHGHHKHSALRDKVFTEDGKSKPTAVLCWIDNEKTRDGKTVQDHVRAVYELQSLIREGKKMIWWSGDR